MRFFFLSSRNLSDPLCHASGLQEHLCTQVIVVVHLRYRLHVGDVTLCHGALVGIWSESGTCTYVVEVVKVRAGAIHMLLDVSCCTADVRPQPVEGSVKYRCLFSNLT